MRKLKLLLLATLTILAGCAGRSALIHPATSVRSDVFMEQPSNGGAVPKGVADMRIAGSLKTHKPGVYSAKDLHGTPAYQLHLNVDGQSVEVPGNLQEESLDWKDRENPEAGEGIRYRFRKQLRLKPGRHLVTVALPGDRIVVAREVTLVEGEVNSLELEPVYGRVSEKRRPSANRLTSFEEGVVGIRLTLNGREL